jgi:endoglucanase
VLIASFPRHKGQLPPADHPGGTINLTPGFFNSINDGAHVTLTFHVCSGATVTYSVTKSGTPITGAAG